MWLSGQLHWNLNDINSINHRPSTAARPAALKHSGRDLQLRNHLLGGSVPPCIKWQLQMTSGGKMAAPVLMWEQEANQEYNQIQV